MYLVRVSFINRFGSPFHWDFQMETDDYAEACDEAVRLFWSGLTESEREDAIQDIRILAHPNTLPNCEWKESWSDEAETR